MGGGAEGGARRGKGARAGQPRDASAVRCAAQRSSAAHRSRGQPGLGTACERARGPKTASPTRAASLRSAGNSGAHPPPAHAVHTRRGADARRKYTYPNHALEQALKLPRQCFWGGGTRRRASLRRHFFPFLVVQACRQRLSIVSGEPLIPGLSGECLNRFSRALPTPRRLLMAIACRGSADARALLAGSRWWRRSLRGGVCSRPFFGFSLSCFCYDSRFEHFPCMPSRSP